MNSCAPGLMARADTQLTPRRVAIGLVAMLVAIIGTAGPAVAQAEYIDDFLRDESRIAEDQQFIVEQVFRGSDRAYTEPTLFFDPDPQASYAIAFVCDRPCDYMAIEVFADEATLGGRYRGREDFDEPLNGRFIVGELPEATAYRLNIDIGRCRMTICHWAAMLIRLEDDEALGLPPASLPAGPPARPAVEGQGQETYAPIATEPRANSDDMIEAGEPHE